MKFKHVNLSENKMLMMLVGIIGGTVVGYILHDQMKVFIEKIKIFFN